MSKRILLWQIGNLSNNIVPSKELLDKLKTSIAEAYNSPDETTSIVWGPDLTVKEIVLEKQ